MKKVLSLMLALLLLTLVACNSDGTSPTTPASSTPPASSPGGSSETPTEEVPKEIVELTAWSPSQLITGSLELNQMDSKLGKIIAEQTGVSFTVRYISAADPEQDFNLKLTTNDWEDVIAHTLNTTWVEKLVAADVIMPLDDYFNQPDKYPNLAKIPKEVLDNFRGADGHIYYFPSQWYEDMDSIYGYWCADGFYVHPDYLAAVNMTKDDLSTLEGIENFLRAVKAANMKTADGLNVAPMNWGQNGSGVRTILTAFAVTVQGTTAAPFGFDVYEGELINFRDHPNSKRAFEWMNKMFNEGLIDQEISSHPNDIFTEKLMNERVALVADGAWSFWGAVTSGDTPVTKLEYLPFPKVDGVSKLGIRQVYDPLGTSGIMVTKNCKDPDAVAALADWGSVTGKRMGWFASLGLQGVTWDYDPVKGEPWFVYTDDELKTAVEAGDYQAMEKVMGGVITVTPFCEDINYFNVSAQENLKWIFDMHRFNAEQGYHTIKRPMDKIILPSDGAMLTNINTIRTLDTEYFIKLVTAPAADFEKTWDEWHTQLEQQGNWAACVAEYTAAYNAMN